MRRNTRRAPGGTGVSRHTPSRSKLAGLTSNAFQSKSETATLIESAMSDLPSLANIVRNLIFFSDEYRRDTFEVVFHHLQTPVEQLLCEKDDPYDWIMESFVGIKNLLPYFERDAAHRKCFTKCWPHIFKWLQALLAVGEVFTQLKRFLLLTGDIFDICCSVGRHLLDDDDVLKFAVDSWIGFKSQDDKDVYTGKPLLSCLGVLVEKGDKDSFAHRMKYALLACNSNAKHLVDKLIARFKHATVAPTSYSAAMEAFDLIDIMVHISAFRQSFFSSATFRPSVGGFVTSYLKVLIDDPNPTTQKDRMIYGFLTIPWVSLLCKPVKYATALVEGGILVLLLNLAPKTSAAVGSVGALKNEQTVVTGILRRLQLCLIHDKMVLSSREALYSIYNGNLKVLDMLKTSPKYFQDSWKSFEAALLEHSIFLHLFKGLYALEDGICANRACRRVRFRVGFKKCSGCMFALYCSHQCQKADWNSHRNACKSMNERGVRVMQDHLNRFPRKIAALRVNRHWKQIGSRARDMNIPARDVAVRVNCTEVPLGLEVIDCHSLLETNEANSHVALFANEIKRQSDEGLRDWVIVILSMAEMEYPCLVHIDDTWTRSVSEGVLSKLKDRVDGREPVKFVDKQDALARENVQVDALLAGVQLAGKYAIDLGGSVWSENIQGKAVEDVLEDFEDIIGSLKSGPMEFEG